MRRLSRLVLALSSVFGFAPCLHASVYTPGFIWDRTADFQGGTSAYTTAGNPNNDAAGNPTWYYEAAQGGNLASADPWYAQSKSLLIWSPGTQQWRDGSQDQSPEVGPTQQSQADINFTFASPVVRWTNPTGQTITTNISVGTNVVSFRQDSGSYDMELAVVEYHSSTQSYQVLWSEDRTVPHNGQVQSGPSVTLMNQTIGAGDSVLFTSRINIDTPLGGNGSAQWFDGASLTLVPEPASLSILVLGAIGVLPRRRVRHV